MLLSHIKLLKMLKNKNFLSSILLILTIALFSGCSNEENSQIAKEQNLIKEDLNQEANRGNSFSCHDVHIGISWPISVETTLHYCCVGESLCGTPPTTGCVCGFVSDTNYEVIKFINEAGRSPYTVHVSQLVPKQNPKKVTISYSSSISIDDIEYKVVPKSYFADKDGYVVLELKPV